MNLYSLLRKKHRSFFAGALFATAFLAAFFVLHTPAQAELNDYVNLFSGKSPGPLLQKKLLVSPVTPGSATFKPDIKFNFQGSFPFLENGNHEKAWYWEHIRDFDDSDYVFMLRICDTASTDESTCLFSIVPHQSESHFDEDLFCPTATSCVLPDLSTAPTTKIYHYTAQKDATTGLGLEHSEIQFDKFNVLFDVKSLARLKAAGGLDTPINIGDTFRIGNPTVYKADIWYCSKKIGGEDLPLDDLTPKIRHFNNLCGDNLPYFKIAESATFKMPQTISEASTQTLEPIDPVDTTPSNSDGRDGLPSCGIGQLMGCVARVIYYVIFWPIQWVAGILGRAFDFFLGYSISDESYRSDIIVTGWKLVRDISNIFFIIILVWTGLSAVLGIGKVSMKSVVPALIINALVINFSLFATRVVVDISNVSARVFYSTMNVCDGKCEYDEKGKIKNYNTETTGGFKPLSTKIVDAFDPQTIFSPKILDPDNTTVGANQQGDSNLKNAAAADKGSADYAGYFIIVSLIAAFIMFGIAKMFFGVMFMFVGRTIGLYMVMVFSPFAVLTRGGMPLVDGIKELGWKEWKKDLVSYSLLAPVFVFFLYIIYAFINSDLMTILHLETSDGFMGTVIKIVIPMALIYMLVQKGVDLAKRYSGKAGEMVSNALNKATGFATGAALGVATGGLGLVGRGATSALGKGAGTWAAANKDSGGIKGAIAGRTNQFLNWGQKSSFDMRNTKLGGRINTGLGALGIKPDDRISGRIGLGQKQYLGGNQKIIADREKAKQKKIEAKYDLSHLTDEQAKKAWERRVEAKGTRAAEQSWETARLKQLKSENTAFQALQTTATALEAELTTAKQNGNSDPANEKRLRDEIKENKKGQAIMASTMAKQVEEQKRTGVFKISKEYTDALAAEKKAMKDKYGDVKNADQLSKALRYDYAQRMLENSLMLSEKKKRNGLWQTGGGATAGVGFGVLGTGLLTGGASILGGGLVANYIDSLQESDKRVFSKIVADYEKNKGKDTKTLKLKAKLQEIDDLIDRHIESVLPAGKSLKDLKPEEKKEHFDRARTEARTRADMAEDEYKAAREAAKAATATQQEKDRLRTAAEAHRKAQDEVNAMNNAHKNREATEEALEKEAEKVKASEEKKKEADKPKS